MIRDSVKDEIRNGFGGVADLTRKVKRIYPELKEMDRLLLQDEKLFMSSLDAMIGPILKLGPDKNKTIDQFPEPITLLAGPFIKGNVDLKAAAFDLGIDPNTLKIAIENNPKLRDTLGQKILATGGSIKRAEWQSKRGVTSPFQEAAQELRLGQPFITRYDR